MDYMHLYLVNVDERVTEMKLNEYTVVCTAPSKLQ